MRSAQNRSRSGFTLRSWLATMNQLGLVFQATPGTCWSNRSAAGGVAVASTRFCSASGRSPAKSAMAPGPSQIRPSATWMFWKTGVWANLA
jgi:hypothetical protein